MADSASPRSAHHLPLGIALIALVFACASDSDSGPSSATLSGTSAAADGDDSATDSGGPPPGDASGPGSSGGASTSAGSSSSDGAETGPPQDPPEGGDVDTPFPIDRGDDPGTPGTYKGLPLRLVDNGEPTVTAVGGVIGVVCIGMSNSAMECDDFIAKLGGQFSAEVNPEVRVVNCAVTSNALERWIDPGADSMLWDPCIDSKIGAAGVSLDQVRVLYHKAADMFTSNLPVYPDPQSDYFAFVDNLDAFSLRAKEKFPGLEAVYTSSRIYGGFAMNPDRGEPLSYEEGHALNTWLDTHSSVDAVWYGWGPYLWGPDCASGETNASDVCYVAADLVGDGVHPSTGARDKVSAMIHARLLGHAWYSAP